MQGNRKNSVDLTGFLRSYPALRAGLAVVVMIAALGAFVWGIRTGLDAGSKALGPSQPPRATGPSAGGTGVAGGPSVATKAPPTGAASPAPVTPGQGAAAGTQAPKETPVASPAPRPGSTARPKPASEASPQQMVWPYQGGIVKAFGWAYSGTHEDWRFHQGIDIAGNEGDEVVAAMGGKVASVEETDLYGVRVVVEHSPRLRTVYTGLSGALVHKGDTVKPGDPIATIGRAAFEWVDPAHLHFETIGESGPVDPAKYLK
ncbi:MAG: peptidoglycan DD-metalloendopeptidase family protein [Firmicutes bacterium]|nr:peptidoglycan DD-metalloendopeptidase family protein [Bacillota bacterium]